MAFFSPGFFNMPQVLRNTAASESAHAAMDPAATPRYIMPGKHRPAAAPDASAETARYISQMTAEMAGMAAAARLDMLAYFLDMARNEAEMLASLPKRIKRD